MRKIKSVIPEECCLLCLNFVHRCTQGYILFQIKLHANFAKKILPMALLSIYKVGDTLLQSKWYTFDSYQTLLRNASGT